MPSAAPPGAPLRRPFEASRSRVGGEYRDSGGSRAVAARQRSPDGTLAEVRTAGAANVNGIKRESVPGVAEASGPAPLSPPANSAVTPCAHTDHCDPHSLGVLGGDAPVHCTVSAAKMLEFWEDRGSPQIADWRRAGRVGERRLACGELSAAPSGKSTVGYPASVPTVRHDGCAGCPSAVPTPSPAAAVPGRSSSTTPCSSSCGPLTGRPTGHRVDPSADSCPGRGKIGGR